VRYAKAEDESQNRRVDHSRRRHFSARYSSYLPLFCEDKNVLYVYVSCEQAPGRACGVARLVIAASITTNETYDLIGPIHTLKDKMERFHV